MARALLLAAAALLACGSSTRPPQPRIVELPTDGGRAQREEPELPPERRDVQELALGSLSSCARLGDGTVRCWGNNEAGQLGDGSVENRATPAAVQGIANAIGIAFALEHGCAVVDSGGVRCWGVNGLGHLGNGSVAFATAPVPVLAVSDVAQVALGVDHGCARTREGTVSCWGANALGAVGDHFDPGPHLTPLPVRGLAGVEQIAASGSTSCARLQGGGVSCWGSNDSGQLGVGTLGGREDRPLPVQGLSGAADVAVGEHHVCAVTRSGAVRCWGGNDHGQLGDGTTENRPTPVAVASVGLAVEVAAGGAHTCVRLLEGGVACWGANDAGQVGDGTTEDRHAPVVLARMLNVGEIAAGGQHSCARANDGGVVCWGESSSGQLGNGTTARRSSPSPVRW